MRNACICGTREPCPYDKGSIKEREYAIGSKNYLLGRDWDQEPNNPENFV